MAPASKLARTLRIPALALASVLVLAGCSGSDDADASGNDSSAESLLPPAEGTTEYPLTVETATGEITIDERPERIIMADSWDVDLFAALGVVPVGTDEQVSFYPWSVDLLPSEIETIWPVGDDLFPAEQIASTNPDLIVAVGVTDPTLITQVEAIAPVLGSPITSADEATWQERILLLGEVLDLSERAESFIDEYDAQFEQYRTDHPEFAGLVVDNLVFWGSEWGTGFMNTTGSANEAFFTSLGFATNPHAGESAYEEAFSDELIGTLQGDLLVISNQESADGEFQTWFDAPLVQSLGSVQAGHDVVLDMHDDFTVWHEGEQTSFTGHFGRAFNVGPYAHLALAELLVPLMADALQH